MKIPKSVKIGGRTHTVKFPYVFQDSIEHLNGQYVPALQEIRIALDDSHGITRHGEAIAITFIHEVLHAIDYVYNGYRITQAEGGEDIIEQMASGIFQVFSDNRLDFSKCER